MDTIPLAEQIAKRLAEYWNLHKTAEFLAYLRETFDTAPLTPPRFECIYIAQAREGNPAEGCIGGLIQQWWAVDDNGLCQISNPDLPLLPDEPKNLRSGFYPRPVLKFYFMDDQVTTGESFGPMYICRKIARLQPGKDGLLEIVESHILWISSSL